jgi:hypothetical protein
MNKLEGTRAEQLIEQVKAKLEVEGIDIQDYNKAIECLKRTVSPNLCVEIYECYIWGN